MRKFLYVAAVAASALILGSPAAEAAPAVHVLTAGKLAGSAVKPGAVLTASLAPGTTAIFKLFARNVTCASSALTATVSANPNAPGTAKASLTAQTFATCATTISGVTVIRVSAANLPYPVAISDAKGHPVTITGRSQSRPLVVTFRLMAGTTRFSCSYTVASLSGHFANATSSVSFSRRELRKSAGGRRCLPEVYFSAVYGQVADSSLTGSPPMFVN